MSRRTKSRTTVVAALWAVVISGVAVGGVVAYGRLSTDEVAVEPPAETSSATAEVRTLSVDFEATGSLVYEPSIAVVSPVGGTVTAVVAAGTTLSSGDLIAVVDDVPVVWLDGEVPAWRTMADGDIGDDVAQLETALDALGFNGDADVTIDDEYTAATAAMVEAWQDALGAPTTGRVELGAVVFGGERSRVAGVAVAVGSSVAAETELVSLGTDGRVATFEVAPGDAVTLTAGDEVTVRLPDRSSVDATVGGVARAADAWTVTTTFGQVDLPVLDVVDVSLEWERAVVADELTIPSSALLRLDDGSYVVDVVSANGGSANGGSIDGVERRRVQTGAAVGTRVVVSAGLSAGDVVIVL